MKVGDFVVLKSSTMDAFVFLLEPSPASLQAGRMRCSTPYLLIECRPMVGSKGEKETWIGVLDPATGSVVWSSDSFFESMPCVTPT